MRENEARAAAEEKRLKAEMAKIASEKARKDREAKRKDVGDGAKAKRGIDDNAENVMEDLLSALASSGPANNVRFTYKYAYYAFFYSEFFL